MHLAHVGRELQDNLSRAGCYHAEAMFIPDTCESLNRGAREAGDATLDSHLQGSTVNEEVHGDNFKIQNSNDKSNPKSQC